MRERTDEEIAVPGDEIANLVCKLYGTKEDEQPTIESGKRTAWPTTSTN